jgi:hypothetical protein
MLENISNEELIKLIGSDRLKVFDSICNSIDKTYEMDKTWNNGGKKWGYEYKYRRGGKTLCAFYFKESCLGLMIIFGKNERLKVENIREQLSKETLKTYDEAQTYHDGKWVMFEIENISLLEDIKKLLLVKRKPNRK